MAEPAGKRPKRSLPLCRAHRSRGGRARHNLPSPVEEALCAVSSLLWDGVYRLQALVSVFERDDVSLPRLASFFQQEARKQQDEAEAMLSHLAVRGGSYCSRDIQKPGCEAVCSVSAALELLHLQLKEEIDVLLELNQLALGHGDPHTASVVKSHFLAPRLERLKVLGGLLANARRLGCTNDATGRLGEYILNELQEELVG